MIVQAALLAHWWSSPSAPRPWWAWALTPLSWAYRAAAGWDRLRHKAPGPPADPNGCSVPTLVVGNWVVGGAGKTPTTLALLAHLRRAGWTPGVVSRGYGRQATDVRLVKPREDSATDVGDEPLLIARAAGVPIAVGRDRVAARRLLLSRHPEVDIVVADDGLQHHRLHRDLAIVVVDERGAGNGRCLPAGPLREPIPSRLPESMIVVYSGGRASLPLPGHLAQRRLTGVQSLSDWVAGRPLPPDGGWPALAGRPVHAAAGIAVPQRFFDLLTQHGVALGATHALPDHDDWTEIPWPGEAADVIVTEKDAVKLARRLAGTAAAPSSADRLSSPPRLWVARLDLLIPPECWAAVDSRLPPAPRAH